MSQGNIHTNSISGMGIAIGHGAHVQTYHIHYYPITLRASLRQIFAPLIDEHLQLFGGRDRVLDQIAHVLQQPAGRILVITAPAGFGKTALLAALVYQTPEAFAYHFFTNLYDDSTLREDFFLRNVVQQMAEWHGYTDALPTDINDLRALYQYFFDKPLEHTRVLVLDGLDEVTTWSLMPYLRRRLPDRLHLILSVRDTGQDWRRDYHLSANYVLHMPLDGLQRDEVLAVLQVAQPNDVSLDKDTTLVDQVLQMATYEDDPTLGADPLYIRLLAKDISDGYVTPTTIVQRPRGLNAYLDDWWQTIRQRAVNQPTRDLLGTLTAALGPLGRADLERINPGLVDDWDADYFGAVLAQVRRFVAGNDAHGYTLVHPRLRDYLHQRIKIRPYCAQLLTYCAQWDQHHSRYALRYYAQHLQQEGQTSHLLALCTNLLYLALKSHYCTTTETENDLLLAKQQAPHDMQVDQLYHSFTQIRHLVDTCDHLNDLKTTLYSRLCHIDGLKVLIAHFESYLEPPYVVPIHPLPDLPHPALLRTWHVSSDAVVQCDVSTTGTIMVATADAMSVTIWDAIQGRLLHTLEGHTRAIQSCAISADGRIAVSASQDKTVRIWDTQHGVLLAALTDHTNWIQSCAISADSRTIVSGSRDKLLKVWNTDNATLRTTLIGHTSALRDCAISGNGAVIVSIADDQTLRFWHGHTGEIHDVIINQRQRVTCCTISHTGHTAVLGTADGALKIWDVPSHRRHPTLLGHTGPVHTCAISADSQTIVSGAGDGTVKLWRVATPPQTRRRRHLYQPLRDTAYGCTAAADGRLVCYALVNGTLKIWDAATRHRTHVFPRHPEPLQQCILTKRDMLIITVVGKDLFLWKDGKHAGRLTGHSRTILQCAADSTGRSVISVSNDKTVKLRDGLNATLRATLSGHTKAVTCCAIDAMGNTIISGSRDKTLKVWHALTGQLLHTLTGHTKAVTACTISAQGHIIASASKDMTLRIWNTHTGQVQATLIGHQHSITDCAITADGCTIISVAEDKTLKVWDTITSSCLVTLSVESVLRCCRISEDGQWVLAGSDSGFYYLRLVNLAPSESGTV